MSILQSYALRLERKRLRARAFRKRRETVATSDRTADIKTGDTLLFCTVRDGAIRLPFFLDHYRKIGIDHFIFVDNGSTDGTGAYLADNVDVSVFATQRSYKNARFGVDWLHWLQNRHGHGHWCVTVDIDEFLVYPFCDRRPIRALTDWLETSEIRSFGALMLDTYAKGPLTQASYVAGQDPFSVAPWFDSGNYLIEKNRKYWNLWIQGGPRARMFFADDMKNAPALNKIPLVQWDRKYTYVSSTHMLLPRGLNLVYDQRGGEKTSGCLLHAKLIDGFIDQSLQQVARDEHFKGSHEYKVYSAAKADQIDFWHENATKYEGWQSLEMAGLMSKGNWA